MAKLSRRKIADLWASELVAGRDITAQVAGYLLAERRVDEAELIETGLATIAVRESLQSGATVEL